MPLDERRRSRLMANSSDKGENPTNRRDSGSEFGRSGKSSKILKDEKKRAELNEASSRIAYTLLMT
jgi:hypothetical protein